MDYEGDAPEEGTAEEIPEDATNAKVPLDALDKVSSFFISAYNNHYRNIFFSQFCTFEHMEIDNR